MSAKNNRFAVLFRRVGAAALLALLAALAGKASGLQGDVRCKESTGRQGAVQRMSDETQNQPNGVLSRRAGGTNGNGNRNGNGNGKHDSTRIMVPEEYARLHADLERASTPSRCFVVGVTSAVYGEGKTTAPLPAPERPVEAVRSITFA